MSEYTVSFRCAVWNKLKDPGGGSGTVGKYSPKIPEWLPSISLFQTLHKRTAYFIMATEENTEVLYNLNLFIVVIY